MLIEIKETELCKLDVQFEADPSVVEEKRIEVLQQFKEAKMPGFRPGKAPIEAIKLHFKKQIDEATVTHLFEESYYTVIAEKNIRPFGKPQFISAALDGSKFKCNFSLHKVPDVELKQYKGFELPKGNILSSVEMSEKILQKLRTDNGVTVPFENTDFVQDGDTVIVNVIGYLPDEAEPAIKIDGNMLVVGKSDIPSFNEDILGMCIGDKREFTFQMPENNTSFPHIAGKEVRCEVELIMGSKSYPCALDDALALKTGAKDTQDLISMIQGMSSNRVQELEQKYLSEQVSNRLIENHTLEIPEWFAVFEARLLSKQHGHDWDNMSENDKHQFLEFATKNIKLSIILHQIREVEPDAQLGDEEVIKLLQTNISKYKNILPGMANKSDPEVFEFISKTGFMPALTATIRDEFALNFIIKNSNIVE